MIPMQPKDPLKLFVERKAFLTGPGVSICSILFIRNPNKHFPRVSRTTITTGPTLQLSKIRYKHRTAS